MKANRLRLEKKFDVIERAGGIKLPHMKSGSGISFTYWERLNVIFSLPAFLFGFVYYIYHGLWKKSLILVAFCLASIELLDIIFIRYPSIYELWYGFSYLITPMVFALRANGDLYTEYRLNKNVNNSLWSDAMHRLTRNKAAMLGACILILLITLAALAPWIAPYSYSYQDLNLGASPPSADHLLGTDVLGRDLLSRILYGARISLLVGFVATGVALVIGVSWGIIAGYAGGKVDSIMMRIVDVLYGLPFIIFIILLMVIFGRNLWLLFGAIGAVEWLTMARIVRGQVIGLKNQEFVMAAKAMGVSNLSMFRRHLLPNILGPIAVYATLTIPQVMLLEGFLSFLGLGIQPPMSSWGTLIKDGVESMEEYSWLLIYPGLTFTITLFALNFFGDGLRDALDPKTTDN